MAFGVVFCLSWEVRPTSSQTFCDSVVGTACRVTSDKDWSDDWSQNPVINIGIGPTPPNQTPRLKFHSGANIEASNNIQIGNQPDTDAALIVTGDGTVTSTGRMGVGSLNNAKGTLIVEDNGLVQVNGLFNSAFNPANTATITVQTGGRVEVSGNALIARGGTADATVDGDGARFDVMGSLYVGNEIGSNGTLVIQNGGFVSATTAGLGWGGNGTVTVTGPGSSLSTNGELRIGGGRAPAISGTGTLSVSDGGAVSSGFVSFGYGNGTLNIGNDGMLETGRIFRDPAATGSTHTINFDGGTLRLRRDVSDLFANLSAGSVVLGAGGGIFDTQDYDVSVVSDISGTGMLSKIGTGTLRFTVPMTYTGDTIVEQGILAAGSNDTFASLSHHIIRSNGTLFAEDFDQTLPSLQNEGVVSLSDGTAGNVFTVTGNYVGAGGTIVLDTVLGDDTSPTDLFRIQGDSLGAGILRIQNAGGGGAQTDNGIKVIDVTGASTGTFSLLGDYVHQGEQAVVGGAYAYKLYQGGTATPGDGDWYLRSQLIQADPVPAPDPDTPPALSSWYSCSRDLPSVSAGTNRCSDPAATGWQPLLGGKWQ